MTSAYLNRIATAVPDHDVHRKFVRYAPSMISDERKRRLFSRMVERAQIEHRYSFLSPNEAEDILDKERFYVRGAFPDTRRRMRFYERHAFTLARRALDRLAFADIADGVTHLIVTSCTGFYAPGIDVQIVAHYGLKPSVERTIVGFMGCHAALNALKLARHIVRSDPAALVAVVNLELCTLHFQESDDLEQMLAFLIFADGCAASLVSARAEGIELQTFSSALLPGTDGHITWHIGELGFDMLLSGQVPMTIAAQLRAHHGKILGNRPPESIRHWAVHPGGRSILDAVEMGLDLGEGPLAASRRVLRRFGNMSSASVMAVLEELMKEGRRAGEGCAMAFGPGLVIESMRFAMNG